MLTTAEGPEQEPTTRTPFWYGALPGFADNFYMRVADPIKFTVSMVLRTADLEGLPGYIVAEPVLDGHAETRVDLAGAIAPAGENGSMFLERLDINSKQAYVRIETGGVSFLPEIKGDQSKKEEFVRALLEGLTDSVEIIPSHRYLAPEGFGDSIPVNLESSHYKAWLHGLSLSRSGYATFETIKRWFNEPPFSYGEISFLRANNNIEIMVQNRDGFRLPIDANGTGVQQLLVLLGFIAATKAQVICVEEPELNLSYRNQDAVVNKIVSLINATDSNLEQLLLTSHSDHIGRRTDLAPFHVSHDGISTQVRTFTAADRSSLFSNRFRIPRPIFDTV